MAVDPYRVLGLPPGASAAEVKRAYRRLAKANHPDSAGEAALPRFLEIQRAYETLTSVVWRPGLRRPASTEPRRADPTRARSTPGAQPSGGGPSNGRSGSTGASGERRAGTGTRSGSGQGTRSDGSTGRRRSTKKATFGSTTYDETHDQADTAWSGASWYGPTSGEYWRVNPREYADPRKHGPEYLARAAARAAAAAERRARQESVASSDAGAITDTGPARHARPRASTAATQRPRPEAARERASDPASRQRPAWTPPARRSGVGAATASTTAEIGTDRSERPAVNLSPGARRILRAVVAWPPLGIAAAAVIGEATGCAAFEATCAPPADLYPWFAQSAIVLALFAVPGVARVFAGGTLAVAILAFPVAAVLSAGGASYDRTYGPAALIVILAIVWAVGVGAALMRRVVTRWLP
ncbi:MAG: hypothetical protein C0498_00350 [Anaerolinea sp.]|nr:hypothetical protein [Anaerolinea sp.]